MSIQYVSTHENENPAVFTHIVKYLEKTGPQRKFGSLGMDTPLLESGILDSLGIMQLIMFLSETMQLEIDDDDFVPENFETIGRLTQYVSNKRKLARR